MPSRAAFLLNCLVLFLAAAPATCVQERDPEVGPLPYALSDQQLRNTARFAVQNLPAPESNYRLRPEFFAGLNSRPRLSLEYRVLQSATEYSKRRGQYVRCQFANGRVIVGTVDAADNGTFNLQTDDFNYHEIKYSEVRSELQPVNGAGQKFVRGAASTGMVTVIVILLPILIPVFTLSCLAGSCMD